MQKARWTFRYDKLLWHGGIVFRKSISGECVLQAVQALQDFSHRNNGGGMNFAETVNVSIGLHNQAVFAWTPKNPHPFRRVAFFKARVQDGKFKVAEVLNESGDVLQPLSDELNESIRTYCEGLWQ